MSSNELPPLVDGATRLYGILGDPIAQVKSPAGITARFRAKGHNAICLPFHARAEDFDTIIRGLKAMPNLDGFILTVPHKVRAMAYVDEMLPTATRVGAVNVVRRRKNGTWLGDMTDGYGMVNALRNAGFEPKGKRATVMGAGGAGGAIIDKLAESGAAEITVVDVDTAKAKAFVDRLSKFHPGCKFTIGAANADDCDALINATPIGMAPKCGLPAPFKSFRPELVVGEVITDPKITDLLAIAQKSGCRFSTGVQMFDAQVDFIADYLLQP
jgi:shikimate dehydrogenase